MKASRLIILAFVAAAAAALAVVGVANAQAAGIVAKYVEGPLPITEPTAALWNKLDGIDVTLGPQLTAQPWIHPEPSIRLLKVKAVNNGTWVAFLLEWSDKTKDDVMRVNTFRDSVAIMLALEPGAGQCMGTPSSKVLIAHWKADWQKDVDEGFTDMEKIYLNFWTDWYPLVLGGKPPYNIKQLTNTSATRLLIAGLAAGNILSNINKINPVETLVAHGWGTLTTAERQLFIGRGIYDGNGWKVVIARPIVTGVVDPPWTKGDAEIVFAIWDGSHGEIGAKKGVSLPMTLRLEMPAKGVVAEKTVERTITVTKTVTEKALETIPAWLTILVVVIIGLFIIGAVMLYRRGRASER